MQQRRQISADVDPDLRLAQELLELRCSFFGNFSRLGAAGKSKLYTASDGSEAGERREKGFHLNFYNESGRCKESFNTLPKPYAHRFTQVLIW